MSVNKNLNLEYELASDISTDTNDTNNDLTETIDIEILLDLADLFKVFGDSTRLRIMVAISKNEMSVLHIAQILNMEQSTISHQLRVLRQNKLVRVRREGKQIYYSLDDDHVKEIIEMGLDHILE
jgi:ArsR family transcriptional regulator